MDEVHFQQHGSRCRMWIPPEDRDPIVKHHPTRKGMGYFGAVRIRDGFFVFRREPNTFNAQTCKEFLMQLDDASVTSDKRIVVIADNARYHHAKLHSTWRQERSDRFALDFLPPYSPELNPIQRAWKLTRPPKAGITSTSRRWMKSSQRWNTNSLNGAPPTKPCVAYAQSLKASRIA